MQRNYLGTTLIDIGFVVREKELFRKIIEIIRIDNRT
jgi:hypothetical protein